MRQDAKQHFGTVPEEKPNGEALLGVVRNSISRARAKRCKERRHVPEIKEKGWTPSPGQGVRLELGQEPGLEQALELQMDPGH